MKLEDIKIGMKVVRVQGAYIGCFGKVVEKLNRQTAKILITAENGDIIEYNGDISYIEPAPARSWKEEILNGKH